MNTTPIVIYISRNQTNSSECLVEALALPAKPADLQCCLERLQVCDRKDGWGILSGNMVLAHPKPIICRKNELNRLNYLAALLASRDHAELDKLNAVMEHHAYKITGVEHLIDIVLHIDTYQHAPTVWNNAELGQYRLEHANYSADTYQTVLGEYNNDYRAYGRDIAREEKGRHTVSGYVSKRESRPGDKPAEKGGIDPKDYVLIKMPEIDAANEMECGSGSLYFFLHTFMTGGNCELTSDGEKALSFLGWGSNQVEVKRRIHHAIWQEKESEE